MDCDILKKAHFAYSDRVNLDTSLSVVRLLLNQNKGKNALLGLYSVHTKYIQVGFVHSPYLFSKGVQARHGG